MLAFIFTHDFWLLVCLVVFVIYMATGGLVYINISSVVKEYINVFSEEGDISYWNLIFFFGFPLVLATASNMYKLVSKSTIELICTVIAILTAMLFSFLAIFDSKLQALKLNKQIDHSRFNNLQTVYTETMNIICFEILVSVFLLIVCFTNPLLSNMTSMLWKNDYAYISVKTIASWLIYYCFYSFLLNLLIVNKRFACAIKE